MSITKYIGGDALIKMMEGVQDICASIHTVRARCNIRVRQPLKTATVVDTEGKFSWLPFAKDMQDIITKKYITYIKKGNSSYDFRTEESVNSPIRITKRCARIFWWNYIYGIDQNFWNIYDEYSRKRGIHSLL